jgi:hypothetical protein
MHFSSLVIEEPVLVQTCATVLPSLAATASTGAALMAPAATSLPSEFRVGDSPPFCPGRKPPLRAVKRLVCPYKSAIQIRFTAETAQGT